MKKTYRHVSKETLLFGFDDESARFRKKWIVFYNLILFLLLTCFVSLAMILSNQQQFNFALVISLNVVKYATLLITVYFLARRIAGQYFNDVYEFDDERIASKYLEEIVFGLGSEKVIISGGWISKRESPLILVGGPGEIQVGLDNVVLLESANGASRIIYPQSEPWKLGAFEYIRKVSESEYAIINLREHLVSGLSVKSRTKDGVPIEAQNIQVIFNILRNSKLSESEKEEKDPYSFDPKAVESLIYNQIVTSSQAIPVSSFERLLDTTVISLIYSEIEEFITSHTLNELISQGSQKEVDNISSKEKAVTKVKMELNRQKIISPTSEHLSPIQILIPESKITTQFLKSSFKEKASALGVSIERINVGQWQFPPMVSEKHKEAWYLSRENSKKYSQIEKARKAYTLSEFVKIVNSVIALDQETTVSFLEFITPQEMLRLLKSFRQELVLAQELIVKESQPQENTQEDLQRIKKTLNAINTYLTDLKNLN